MSKNVYRMAGLAVAAGATIALTACKCICPENRRAGLPVILCQPMNQQVTTNQDAVFKVRAVGENLSYQWFFQNSDRVIEVRNGQGSDLVVPASTPNRFGNYWCAVRADGSLGLEQIQTRSATLTESFALSGGFTNPTTGTFTTSQGTGSCCNYCGWINFQNGGQGFPLNAGQTVTIQLSLSSTMSPLIDTSNYCARWRYGGKTNQTGCFTVISSTQEQFTAPVTATYAITVYIKNNCPPNGTLYYMTLQ
jgi:hypothetical protein